MKRIFAKRSRSLLDIALADRPAIFLLAIVAPALIIFLSTVLGEGMVRDLPIAVCDQENSALSRKIIAALDASPAVQIATVTADPIQSHRLLVNGTVYGSVTIPADFSANTKGSKPAMIGAEVNSLSYLTAGYVRREIQSACGYFSAGVTITRLTKQGISYRHAVAAAAPVTADVTLAGNHSGNYRWYLIPGMILVQIGGILTIAAMVFTSGIVEKQITHPTGTPQTRSVINQFGVRFFVLIIASLFYCGLIFGIVFPLTEITTPQESFAALPWTALFFLASILLGTGVGFLFNRRINAASAGLIISMPAFIFSGYSYPQAAMPELVKIASQLMPFTHFMPLWNQGVRLGYPVESLSRFWIHLLLISCGGILLTIIGIIRTKQRGTV